MPQRYNDGASIEDEKFKATWEELVQRFGALTLDLSPIKGFWQQADRVYEDSLIRITLDVEDTVESKEFFVKYKETLKERFKQIEIWMTAYPIEIL